MEKKKSKIWLWILIALVSFIIIGALSSKDDSALQTSNVNTSSPSSRSAAATPIKEEQTLKLLGARAYKEEYASYIRGSIKNNDNITYSYVEVDINLYDSHGDVIGSTLANMNNLEPGQTWKFEAVTLDDFSSFKVTGITAF